MLADADRIPDADKIHEQLVSDAEARFGADRRVELEAVLLDVARDISNLRRFRLDPDDAI